MQYNLAGMMGGKTAEEAKKEGNQHVDAGFYEAALTAVEPGKPKPRKDQSGMIIPGIFDTTLKLTFTIQQQGKFQNWKLFQSIGLDHGNLDYMRKSRALVGSLAVALGHTGPVHTLEPFKNKLVLIKVAKREERTNPQTGATIDAQNEIRECRAIGSGTPQTAGQQAANILRQPVPPQQPQQPPMRPIQTTPMPPQQMQAPQPPQMMQPPMQPQMQPQMQQAYQQPQQPQYQTTDAAAAMAPANAGAEVAPWKQ